MAALKGALPLRPTPVLLILAFFLALVPLAGNYAVHHPDEQYYTVASIQMVERGDYLTPRDADGAPRFQKPVLAYWLLAASYRLFGIDAFRSRLPFLLAGCALLAVTYAMARRLTGDPVAALLALGALLAEPQLVLASLRSMTDVVLVLALTVSAWGFLAAMAAERRSRAALAMAYGGAAVAFLSKGAVAIGFVVFALAFAFVERRRGAASSFGSLVDVPSMLGAAILSSAWLVVLALDGGAALAAFVRDQAGARFAHDAASPALIVPGYLALYFVGFLPWSGPAVRALWSDPAARGPRDARRRRLRRFILLWGLLVAVTFGLAREPEEHYVLPAIPLLALLLGDVLASADPLRRGRLLRQSLAVTLAVVLLAGLVMVWTQQQVGAPIGARIALGALLAAVAACGAAGLAGRAIGAPVALALVGLLVYPMLASTLGPIALPDQGDQLAVQLRALGVREGTPVLLAGEAALAGKVRVASAGALDVRPCDSARRGGSCADATALILPRAAAAELDAAWEIHPGSRGYRSMDVVALGGALRRGELRDFLERHRSELVIALRHG